MKGLRLTDLDEKQEGSETLEKIYMSTVTEEGISEGRVGCLPPPLSHTHTGSG